MCRPPKVFQPKAVLLFPQLLSLYWGSDSHLLPRQPDDPPGFENPLSGLSRFFLPSTLFAFRRAGICDYDSILLRLRQGRRLSSLGVVEG